VRHAAVILALATAAALAACTRSEPSPEQAESVRRGREVYVFESCGGCHGSQRQGSEKAPPLAALRRHWSAEELALYLRQPGQFAQDRRLQRLARRYPAGMAGLPAAHPDRLHDLVVFLLSP
jgi:cytochrome c2